MNNIYISRQSASELNCQMLLDELIPFSMPGKALIAKIKPFTTNNFDELNKAYTSLQKISSFLQNNMQIIEDIKIALSHIKTISSTLNRLKSKQTLEVFEIYEIKAFIYFYKKMVNNLTRKVVGFVNLDDVFLFLDAEKQNTPSFYLSNCYSQKLASIRSKIANNSNAIKTQKMHLLNKAKISLNCDLEFSFSVPRFNSELIQKIQNSGYFNLTDENFAKLIFSLKFNDKILNLRKQNAKLLEDLNIAELEARQNITNTLYKNCDDINTAYNFTASFDWIFTKALFLQKYNCCIPKISKTPCFKAVNAANLPLQIKKGYCQKLDFNFNNKLNTITGANMAGKSTILHTVGQFLFLASMAIPVPAKSATVCLVDFIFSSYNGIGNLDLSSFGAEVVSISNIIKRKGRGLFLLDEFARGTNPEEGEAFSAAVLDSFASKNCLVIAATHFKKPAMLKSASHFRVVGIKNFDNVNFDETETLNNRLNKLKQILDYSLIKVQAKSPLPHQAIEIAKILGADKDIIQKTIKFLNSTN